MNLRSYLLSHQHSPASIVKMRVRLNCRQGTGNERPMGVLHLLMPGESASPVVLIALHSKWDTAPTRVIAV